MEPDNALYDAACDLLSAARRVDRAVQRDGVAPAIPATLGCLHATLAQLTSACAALSTKDPSGRNDPEDLVFILRRAAAACDAARASSGEPAL